MPTLAIIGAGQIGYAAAHAFSGAEWDVTVHARSRPTWPDHTESWRAYVAGENPAPAADVVIDTIAFDEADVERYDPDKVGRLIAISSASVYCDDAGRTLDEGMANGYPEFSAAVTEDQSTIAAGPETYSTRKVRMENAVSERFASCATILRPCAIYGPQSRHPREWWFVKRLIDGRRYVPVLFDGRSRFQTTDVAAIAHFCVAAAEGEVGGIYNIADTNSPSVRQIGQAIASVLDCPIEFVDAGEEGLVGRTPWSIPRPFTVNADRAARVMGQDRYEYADHVQKAVHWLRDLNPANWRSAFPQIAAYPWDLFDYEAEDRFIEKWL